jgi:oleandomycin transport system ATP-binding protein
VGRDRLIVQVAEPARLEDARRALTALAGDPPDVPAEGVLSLSMTGPDLPAAAVRALDASAIGIAGLEVRTPTLDDVFFALTGKHVDVPDEQPEEVAA